LQFHQADIPRSIITDKSISGIIKCINCKTITSGQSFVSSVYFHQPEYSTTSSIRLPVFSLDFGPGFNLAYRRTLIFMEIKMIIGYLSFLVLVIVAFVLGVYYFRHPSANIKAKLRWLVILMALISVILTVAGIISLQKEIASGRWPSTEGQIIASEVKGERAFHPEITYLYTVDGHDFSGTSALNTPGFGGKRNRLELAEYLIAQYPIGSPITVHYKPDDPKTSELHTGMTYRTLLETALGLILMIGTIIVALRLFQRNRVTRIKA
jgi:hypothetical protein